MKVVMFLTHNSCFQFFNCYADLNFHAINQL